MSSFTTRVKDALCQTPRKNAQLGWELAGMLRACGGVRVGGGGPSLALESTHKSSIMRAMRILQTLYGQTCEFTQKQIPPQTGDIYECRFSGREMVERALTDAMLPLLDTDGLARAGGGLPDAQSRSALLRGAFLGGGAVNDPNKDYHLSFTLQREDSAQAVLQILADCGIKATRRTDAPVVYIKSADGVKQALSQMGAYGAVLELEEVQILRDLRNHTNRQANCNEANTNKTARAAVEQTRSIELLVARVGLENLPPGLAETAQLRLANPEATLAELAALHHGTTRSGVNHRLRKLKQLAESMKTKEDPPCSIEKSPSKIPQA